MRAPWATTPPFLVGAQAEQTSPVPVQLTWTEGRWSEDDSDVSDEAYSDTDNCTDATDRDEGGLIAASGQLNYPPSVDERIEVRFGPTWWCAGRVTAHVAPPSVPSYGLAVGAGVDVLMANGTWHGATITGQPLGGVAPDPHWYMLEWARPDVVDDEHEGFLIQLKPCAANWRRTADAGVLRVAYDDGTRVDHPLARPFRERYEWRYEDLPSQPRPHAGGGLGRGSGRAGETSGVDFDQYERDEDDGVFLSKARRRTACEAEFRYAARGRADRKRQHARPGAHGYQEDGFVVADAAPAPGALCLGSDSDSDAASDWSVCSDDDGEEEDDL